MVNTSIAFEQPLTAPQTHAHGATLISRRNDRDGVRRTAPKRGSAEPFPLSLERSKRFVRTNLRENLRENVRARRARRAAHLVFQGKQRPELHDLRSRTHMDKTTKAGANGSRTHKVT